MERVANVSSLPPCRAGFLSVTPKTRMGPFSVSLLRLPAGCLPPFVERRATDAGCGALGNHGGLGALLPCSLWGSVLAVYAWPGGGGVAVQ
jgi:hypothetical protein